MSFCSLSFFVLSRPFYKKEEEERKNIYRKQILTLKALTTQEEPSDGFQLHLYRLFVSIGLVEVLKNTKNLGIVLH